MVIIGHSHIPFGEDAEGLLLLDPGSATDRGAQPHRGVALLTIQCGAPRGETIVLP